MKTLAFSVAVALVVTCCHGGAIPELFDGDQGGTSGGTRPGQNLCGANAVPIPGWMSDSGCTAENCPLGVCDESGKACCYDTSDICESGFPHLRPEGCVPNNCEEGTCASFMIASTSVSVCCQVQTLGGGNQGNQNPCPDGKYLGGRDCNNCKGECVSETTQDGTTREACCVDEDDLPDLPDRDAHCKVVNPACTSDSDCEEAHACRQGKCCWLAMETGTDFSMCKSTEMFIGSAMTDAVGCIMPFAAIIDAKSEDEFCSIMWTGIGCIIENLFSAQNERDICHTYIEDLVKSDPSGILNKVEIIVKGIDSDVDFAGIRGYDASLCPGVFDCKYNERGYDEGDTFPDTEVCNRCGCSANGDIYCTEMACIPNNNADCMVKGQAIPSWTNYLHEDGCNVCFCGDGRVKCTDIKRCKRKKDEQDEKDKEEQGGCPPLPLNSFGDCGISECGVNKPCAVGHLCCSNGCGRVCKPDMGVCSNVTKMIEFSDTEDAQQCQSYFVEIATMNQNSEQFCSSFWHGVECLATAFAKNDMMVDKYAKDECLRRMKRRVMATGTAALSEIMARVAMDPTLNVQDVNHNPAECTVVKEREDDDMLMKQEDREDQPEYDREVAAKCANMMEIKAKANQCKREHDKITSSNGYEKKCKAFEKFVECIVGKLFTGANKDEEMRKCIGDLHLFIEKHGDMLKMEFPALANLRVHECLEREHVCGEEMMPLADVMCGAGGGQCPQGSECRGQFCCPAERKGKCPMLRGVPLCDRECEKDEDCQDSHYKCCDQGCGKKTCARLEEEEQSVCQKQFDEAVKNLQQRGICGDGKSSLEIPRCQGTGFAPNQGEYCVKPDGTKIKGSDHFMGNRDCTRVRDGKCPMLEQECRGENIVITNICEHDDDCTNPTEKCCVRRTQGNCLRICTAPETVADNEEVMIPDCPNNEERACCPITSCLGMKCPAHKGAVCKVNSCGGCHVEWFDIDGKKVDNCSEGITPCQQKQAMGMAKNMIARPDMDKLVLFIKGLKEHHSEKKEKDKTEYGDEAKKMDELPMDMYDYEEMSKEDHMKYMSILAEKICKVLNDHGVCMNGGTCALTRPLSERSPYQLCTCPQGYGGLFCEKKPIPEPCDKATVACTVNPCDVTKCPNHPTATCTANYCGGCNAVFKLPDGTDVTYDCSDCRRNQLYIRTAHTILQTLSPASEVLHKLMTINPPPDYVMPQDIQCDAEGHYSPIQSFVFIPITSDDTVFKTCVNPQSGKTIKRIPNTPIVFAKSMQNLDCTLRQTVDAKELNPKCWLKTIGPCEDASKCQWYYNNDNQRCEPGMGGWEPGSGGHGFSSLNECYDTCKPKPMKKCPPVPEDVMGACAEMCPTDGCPAGQMCCSNGCGHVCKSDLVDPEEPLPCKDKQCDYKTQYCNVAQNEQTGEHEGECRDFQAHCILDKEEGYGYGKIGAYYFNVKRRVCMRFNYKGMGGNKNRFYSLHQCQTECAMRDYRYKDPVCPAPKLLMVPGMPVPDMCDCDTDCGEHGGVCCSNGHARVCSIPVRSCLNGHRCSFYGFCDEKSMCQCPDCMDSTDTQKVCGSDGQTYDNECKLQKHACKAMKKIVVKSTGDCPANPPEPTPEECKNSMMCTMEYMPLCVYDTTDPNNITTHTFSNPCQMMVDKKCNSRTVQVLYPGECQRVCGNCPIYNTECVSGQCGCKADCSLAFDGPVCGHQVGHDQTMTFNSICELRQYGCEKKEIYVISKHGPCDGDKKPEELLECPTMDDDTMMMEIRPGMEQATCDVGENGGFCDAETEKCCRLGQGTHCIPKTKLIRPKVMKEGVCPMISGLNFQRKDCYARKCDDNLSCKGDSICCDNFACGHKTCASPVVKPDVCGVGKFMVPHVKCDADTASGCPDKSDCTEVTRGMHKVHVCCAAAADKDLFTKEVIFKTQLCHELKNIGVECANGGKCDPNLKESKICNCAQGFYGPLCRTNTPPTSNKQCLREKAIMAMLSQKLKDLVDKRIIGDNDDGMDENEDYEAMEGMDHDNDGDVDEHDRELELEYWADYLLAEEQLGLRFVKFLAAKGVKYLLHDVQCDENGDFEHAQCGIMLASHRQKCFCIDKSDWMKHLPGPMAATRDKLDCTMLTNGMDIPEFCKMKPMEGMCESQAGRYYFNPDTADCEEFKDMLCADSNGNNFPSLETCRSFCSSRSWTHKDCKKSCPSGHVCRLVRGKEECKDVTKPKEIEKHFEPKCDKDGKFLPKQCSGTLCTCVQPDDGTVIPNALGSGETLGCVKDAAAQHGIRVTRPEQGKRLVCPDGNPPTKFCEDGGNPCNDCQRTMPEQGQQGQGQQGQGQQGQGQQGQGQQGQGQQGQGQQGQGQEGQGQQGQGQMQMHGMMQKQTDEHGVCLECERCPTDQGKKKCPGQCTTACKQNPQATCIVNKCTCKEEFRNSENKLVKCTAAQSQCEKRKDTMYTDFLTKAREATMKRLSGESNSMEDTEEPMDVLHCTENGSFYAHCTGRNDDRVDCYCLDANQFKKAHETPQVVQRNVKPNCDQVQVQTKAKTAIGRLKVAGTLSAWPQTKREKFIEAACAKITRKIPVTCKGRLEEGSVIFVYTLEYDPVSTVEADTSDLASLVATIQSEVNQNEFIFEVDGETYVASEGQVTEFLTAEEVTTTPIDDDDDKKKKETTIIIVVVVVVVVVLLIILATGVYWNRQNRRKKRVSFYDIAKCYRKGKSKQKDIPFDDLQGKSNKAYENPAY